MNIDLIKNNLYDFRGSKVMLDKDLAEYYNISTTRLNEALKRNQKLFPEDFAFELRKDELVSLSQYAILRGVQLRLNYKPKVFTEKGCWMVGFILRNDEANQKAIALIRILEQLRDLALQNPGLIPATTAYQLTSPTSAVNIYNYGTLQVQQGKNNQQHITQLKDVIYTLHEIKEKSDNSEFNKKLDLLISALIKKEDKSKVLKAMESVISVAKGSKAVAEFGLLIAGLVNSYFSVGM